MTKALTLLMAFVVPFAAASTMELDYKALYSHAKKLDDEDYSQLEFAFGLEQLNTSGELCEIRSATLVTDKKTFDLPVTDNRFTIWVERALKLADATVKMDVKQAPEQCGMSVLLRAKPEHYKAQYTLDELRVLEQQFAAFFDDVGSFLSFMMPSAVGIKLYLAQSTPVNQFTLNGESVSVPIDSGGAVHLSEGWLAEHQGTLTLPAQPERIVALMSN